MLGKIIKTICILFVLCIAFSGCYGDYEFYDNNNSENTTSMNSDVVSNNTTEVSSTTSEARSDKSEVSSNASSSIITSENTNISSNNSSLNVSSFASKPSEPSQSSDSESTQSVSSNSTISSTVSETTSSSQEIPRAEAPVTLTEQMQSLLCETFLNCLNEERKSLNLPALDVDTTLQNAAAKRADETTVSFSHTRPNGQDFWTVLPKDFRYSSCGENITLTAYGYKATDFDLSNDGLIKMAKNAFTNFKNSPPHYENLTKKEYNLTGIAFCTGYYIKDKDTVYVAMFCTNLFASK